MLIFRHGDDLIVTPFAQLLASLRNVRSNFISIANLPVGTTENEKYKTARRPPLHSIQLPEPVTSCAQETLEELDWCLEQLEAIQIHRSVSEMASSKVRLFFSHFCTCSWALWKHTYNFSKTFCILLSILLIFYIPFNCYIYLHIIFYVFYTDFQKIF